MTVREFLKNVLVDAGVIAENETPTSSQLSQGLTRLNMMLDTWSADGILIPSIIPEDLTLTAGQQSRTVGPTGDIVTTRPTLIERAAVKINNIESPLEIIGSTEWADIQNKNLSGIPSKLWIQNTFPNETLFLWPAPSAAYTLTLYSRKALTTYALSDLLSLLPGYLETMHENLKVKLGNSYGIAIDPTLAERLLTVIKSKNQQIPLMVSDAIKSTSTSNFNFVKGT